MTLKTVRKMAADIMKCGKSRVRIMDFKRAEEALTREDVKGLVKDKAIIELPKMGISRHRARLRQSRKQMGRGRGRGTKKGSEFAGTSAKDQWMRKVRAQRRTLAKNRGKMEGAEYRDVYRMIKGNAFKARKQLEQYLAKAAATKKVQE